jgi:hypothetical protein
MPPVKIPLVKPDTDTRLFVCPVCRTPCATHSDFTQHFVAQHTPAMTPAGRGPEALPREVK